MISASIVIFHTSKSVLDRLSTAIDNSSIDKLYVIDNSSNDELREYFDNRKNIVYIHSLNLGYGSGHNVAMRKSIEEGFKYHIVINPDVYWKGDIIEPIRIFMDKNPDCGLVMPKVLFPDGSIQYLAKLSPNPVDLLGRRFIPWYSWHEKHDYNYELQWSGYDKIMDVPILSGCFMFLRNSVIEKVGGFDERFFMYAEDVDLCRRIGEVSKTIFFPSVNIYHEYGKGSYKDKKLLKMHIKSVIKYFNKWGWFFDKQRRCRNRECIAKIKSGTY